MTGSDSEPLHTFTGEYMKLIGDNTGQVPEDPKEEFAKLSLDGKKWNCSSQSMITTVPFSFSHDKDTGAIR